MPRFVHVQAETPEATTILIEGLPQPLTLLQITDSHLAEVDQRDPVTFASMVRPYVTRPGFDGGSRLIRLLPA